MRYTYTETVFTRKIHNNIITYRFQNRFFYTDLRVSYPRIMGGGGERKSDIFLDLLRLTKKKKKN